MSINFTVNVEKQPVCSAKLRVDPEGFLTLSLDGVDVWFMHPNGKSCRSINEAKSCKRLKKAGVILNGRGQIFDDDEGTDDECNHKD